MFNPTVVIFLKNKLGSCDAVLPLIMDAKSRNPRLRVEFVAPNLDTFSFIRLNTTLWDAIQSIGTILPPPNGSKNRSRLTRLLRLIRYTGLAVTGGASFLRSSPFFDRSWRWFHKIAPRWCYYVVPTAFGSPKTILGMVALRQDIDGMSKNQTPNHSTISGRIVFIGNAYQMFPANPMLQSLIDEAIVVAPTRTRKVWYDFVRSRAEEYLAPALISAGVAPDSEYLVYLCVDPSPQTLTRHPDSLLRLLRQTMDIFAEHADGRAILIKPHFEYDVPLLEAEIAKRPKLNAAVVHLHPTVLATRARIFVANWTTTPMCDAHAMGVPTIEYSEYSNPLRELTGNSSGWPECTSYFFDCDPEGFTQKLVEILARPDDRADVVGIVDDPSGFIDEIAGLEPSSMSDNGRP